MLEPQNEETLETNTLLRNSVTNNNSSNRSGFGSLSGQQTQDMALQSPMNHTDFIKECKKGSKILKFQQKLTIDSCFYISDTLLRQYNKYVENGFQVCYFYFFLFFFSFFVFFFVFFLKVCF